jgi:hypothetical protein
MLHIFILVLLANYRRNPQSFRENIQLLRTLKCFFCHEHSPLVAASYVDVPNSY